MNLNDALLGMVDGDPSELRLLYDQMHDQQCWLSFIYLWSLIGLARMLDR